MSVWEVRPRLPSCCVWPACGPVWKSQTVTWRGRRAAERCVMKLRRHKVTTGSHTGLYGSAHQHADTQGSAQYADWSRKGERRKSCLQGLEKVNLPAAHWGSAGASGRWVVSEEVVHFHRMKGWELGENPEVSMWIRLDETHWSHLLHCRGYT